MSQLNLPECNLKIVHKNGKPYLWDILRKKYIAITPEEWVRQHFINFLIQVKHYPASLLANEVNIKQNGMNRRCDSVLFDRSAHPQMILEYKAPHIKITAQVFDQILRYNMVLQVKYLIVSNGMEHYCCRVDEHNKCSFLKDIPDYKEL